MIKGSDLLIAALEQEGVERIFGVPGEENADLLMSMRDSAIQFVPTHHEAGAAFMADVYGRLSGHPGVCLSTLGPGASNLVTGVANANKLGASPAGPAGDITGFGTAPFLYGFQSATATEAAIPAASTTYIDNA